MLPWYCDTCALWHPKRFVRCPFCGRSALGRICAKCKTILPTGALYCTACGSDQIIEAARGRLLPPRKIRLPLAVVLLASMGWGWQTVGPSVMASVSWFLGELMLLLTYLFVGWLLTGLLPQPWGRWIRTAVAWTARFLGRWLVNLFK